MLHQTLPLTVYILTMTAILGLVMGSFCNAWAWRLAHGERISRGRSHCTACGHVLSPRDLVPVLSWVLLKGRCRYCGTKISPRYPAAELLSAAYFLTVVWRYDLSPTGLRLLITGCLLLTAALVDGETMELPDRLLAGAVLAGLLRLPEEGVEHLTDLVVGAAAVSVPLLLLVLLGDRLMGRETMGGGDIKLVAVLGIHLGPVQCLFTVIGACLIGLAGAVLTGKKRGEAFPFGPALVLSGWLSVLAGEPLESWYLSLF